MLILMLFAPQMSIIFAVSTSNNPHYQQNLCMREVAYLSLIFTPILIELLAFVQISCICKNLANLNLCPE